MDLDSFLVSLYVLVDDWWQEHHPPSVRKRKPGRPALLSESEVITLAILAQWPRFRSELRASPRLFRREADKGRPRGGGASQSLHLADKGFTGVQWERRWLEEYGSQVAATPKNDSRRAWPKTDRWWTAGKRQIIEGVICQLKDFFGLERHQAKTLGGLLTPLAAKVAAYTCAQRINDSLGRPLRHLAALLV